MKFDWKKTLIGLGLLVAGGLAIVFGYPEAGHRLVSQGESSLSISPTTVQ